MIFTVGCVVLAIVSFLTGLVVWLAARILFGDNGTVSMPGFPCDAGDDGFDFLP